MSETAIGEMLRQMTEEGWRNFPEKHPVLLWEDAPGYDAALGQDQPSITPYLLPGTQARGAVVVDEGAKSALIGHGKSLLCVGVAGVEGRFEAGDIVDIKDLAGHLFARGRAAFSADEVELACGKTREVLERNRLLAALTQRPLVHRDELVVFE